MASFLDAILGMSGQERTEALRQMGRDLEYYVPPELRDRIGLLGKALEFTDAGDMVAAGEASRDLWNNPSVGSAANYAAAGLGLALPVVSSRMMQEGVDVAGDAISSLADDARSIWSRLNQPGPVPTMNAIFPSGSSLDEVFGFLDKNKPIYHSGPADMAEEMQKWGVEPSYGPWVREIAAGAVDDVDEFLDQTPPAAWWSDQPNWIKMKVARAAKKPVSDVTVDDIRKHGHLAIASADDYSDVAFRIGDEGLDNGEYSFVEDLAGNRMRFYETPLYSEGNYPFGIERNEIVTGEAIEPAYSLTGDDLINFMQRRGLLDNPAERVADDFNVTRKDASNIFGEGSERVRYTDAKSGGTMEVVVRPDGSASVLELEVPEASRGQGIGQALQQRVMQDFPVMGGQVSSKAAAKTAYRLGRRPYGQPDATLEDVFRMIDEDSSVNLISPQAQPNILPAPRNEAEAMAKQVLEMRAAGRAGDVTEEMMAATDPQYMFANTPLPMDEASRMARARDAGFQGGLLHGTGSDISAIDPTRLGEKQNVLGKGFYQTTSPERSERYVPKVKDEAGSTIFAEGGNVMPLMSKSADEFDLTAPTGKKNISRIAKAFEGTDFNIDLRDGGDSVFIQSKTDPKMSVFLDSYQEGQSTLMRLKDAFGNNNLTPILEEAGFTGLKGAEGRGSNVRVNYNPEDVRSRFARFDPEFSHLRNLSAGVGGLGLLSLLGQQDQELQ